MAGASPCAGHSSLSQEAKKPAIPDKIIIIKNFFILLMDVNTVQISQFYN